MSGFGWEWFRLFEGGGSWVYRGWPWIHGFDWVFGFGFPVVFWVGFMWLEVVVVRGGLVWILDIFGKGAYGFTFGVVKTVCDLSTCL